MDKVFAIIGNLKSEPSNYMMLGTGFFIDKNGYFATAGHVFKKNQNSIQQFYICFPKDEEYIDIIPIVEYRFYSRELYLDIERLHKTPRNRYDYQCGPEYFDVGVGKIEATDTPFFEFKIKRPYIWDTLTMPCLNINKIVCPIKKFNLINNKVDSRFIETHNWDIKFVERLKLARIPFLYETMEFKNIDLYNNCIEVYGEGRKGNSGAPVLNENENVVGVFIGGAIFGEFKIVHLSRYVKKKSIKLKKKIIRGE